MSIKCKKDVFLVITLKHVNRPRTPKLWAIAHENGHKMQKRQVFGNALKHVSGTMVVIDHPGTPKPYGISHERVHKMKKKYEFLVITLKHVNRPRALKLWARGHENSPKTQKR